MTPRCLPAFWLARLYVAAHVGVIALVACFGQGTMLYTVVQDADQAGFWCVLAVAVLAGLSALDTLINDLLPARFKLRVVKSHRHYIFTGMAMGLLSLGAVIAQQVGLSTLHASIFLAASGASVLAFLDLYARHAE